MASAHDISLATGSSHTQNFRNAYPNRTKGGKIPKADIVEILSQHGCVELCYYFAIPDPSRPNEISVVFVGVDSNGNDMTAPNNLLKDNVVMCPPVCSLSNSLNP